MAENSLTPEQDLATREFFLEVAGSDLYLRDHPALRKNLISILLTALNYNWLPSGAFIDKDTEITMPFGSYDYGKYADEWEADKERANEALNSKDTTEASTSSESSDTEVREAVLPEDVR